MRVLEILVVFVQFGEVELVGARSQLAVKSLQELNQRSIRGGNFA
jgi:hypothetical protein